MLYHPQLLSQEISQTVRGIVLDKETREPLYGATIRVINTQPVIGTTTDPDGKFRLEKVPLSSKKLLVTYTGYKQALVSDFDLNSVKEAVLEIYLSESVGNLEDIVVTASSSMADPINDFSLIGARSISSEQTWRFAGGFNDPAKITSNFAGVANSQDGGNDIIVRGKSPKYMQWRLEGAEITTPNHFGDQNSISGIVGVLNNNLLSTSDFYTGGFPAEFGNTLSGVYDLRMRKGNNERFEGVFGLGLLGTDITLEGPFSKEYSGSYIVNFRYSTVGMLTDLDLVEVEDTDITFQDASFKIWLPTKKSGSFSVFGLQGKSDLKINDVSPDIWVTPGDDFVELQREDYFKDAYLLNLGVNHSVSVGDQGFLETTLSYSSDEVKDRVLTIQNEQGIIESSPNFTSSLNNSAFRLRWTYHKKFNNKHSIISGGNYSLINQDIAQNRRTQESAFVSLIDFDQNVFINRSFLSWKYQATNNLILVSGFHNQNIPFLDESTFEPRIALSYKTGSNSKLSASFSRMSRMESLHNYLISIPDTEGDLYQPNLDLGLIFSNQWLIGYENYLTENIRFQAELYYENLSNVPVENDPNSSYSTLNEGLELNYVDLVNSGTARNYGLELTLERFMDNGYYFLFNTSFYQSKYTSLDGIERNTRFNGEYLINLLGGKEFRGLGKNKNQEFAINLKSFFGGGRYVLPLLEDDAGNLNVDPENGLIYDHRKAYQSKLDDLMSITLSLSYKWNMKNVTHELFLNIDNLTNNRSRLRPYYDGNEPGLIAYERQVGVIPNILYRVYF